VEEDKEVRQARKEEYKETQYSNIQKDIEKRAKRSKITEKERKQLLKNLSEKKRDEKKTEKQQNKKETEDLKLKMRKERYEACKVIVEK